MQYTQGSTQSRLGNSANAQNASAETLHTDTLSTVESALLLGSFLALAASLASLTAL